MKPEQKFAQWCRDALAIADWQRIESMGSGIPDVNCCLDGFEFWLELKVVTHGRTLLRKEQYAWGNRRANHRGNVFVLSHDESRGLVLAWQFPSLIVQPYSKYLEVGDEFCTELPYDKAKVKSFLISRII